MVSRENRIVAVCVVLAETLGLFVVAAAWIPNWVCYAVMVIVGVILPGYLTGRYDFLESGEML